MDVSNLSDEDINYLNSLSDEELKKIIQEPTKTQTDDEFLQEMAQQPLTPKEEPLKGKVQDYYLFGEEGGTKPRDLGFFESPVDFVEGAIPIGGSVAGGIIGGTAGSPLSPLGTIGGSVAGSGLGTAGGELVKTGIETLRGERPLPQELSDYGKILGEAGTAGLVDSLLNTATLGAYKVAKPIVKASAPVVNSLLMGIPEKSTKRLFDLIENKSDILNKPLEQGLQTTKDTLQNTKDFLLEGIDKAQNIMQKNKENFGLMPIKKNLKEIGDVTKKEVDDIDKYFENFADEASLAYKNALETVGKEVGKYKELIKSKTLNVNSKGLISKLNDVFNQETYLGNVPFEEFNGLKKDIIGNLKVFLKNQNKELKLGDNIDLGTLDQFKKYIQDKYSDVLNDVSKTEKQRFIKGVINNIRQFEYENLPPEANQLIETNNIYSELKKIDIGKQIYKTVGNDKINIKGVSTGKLTGNNKANWVKDIPFNNDKLAFAQQFQQLTGFDLINPVLQQVNRQNESKLALKAINASTINNPTVLLKNPLDDSVNVLRKRHPELFKNLENYENVKQNINLTSEEQIAKNKQVLGLLNDASIKNPFNLLNKTDAQIELLESEYPKLMQTIQDLGVKSEYDRLFPFTKSATMSDRVTQQSAIEQLNAFKKILPILTFGGSVLGPQALGSDVVTESVLSLLGTAATSPKLNKYVLQGLLDPASVNASVLRSVPSGVGANLTSMMYNNNNE
jgi:hypothetical protein